MERLYEIIKKELKEIEQNGISASNIDTAGKLVDMLKDLNEIKGEKHMREYGGDYRKDYRDDRYMNRRYDDEYMRREPMISRYGGNNGRMREHINRIVDGAESYEYGKERYQHGDTEERIYDGLDKLMYAICMFIESMMEFAETPQEKEIIRKHIQKIHGM